MLSSVRVACLHGVMTDPLIRHDWLLIDCGVVYSHEIMQYIRSFCETLCAIDRSPPLPYNHMAEFQSAACLQFCLAPCHDSWGSNNILSMSHTLNNQLLCTCTTRCVDIFHSLPPWKSMHQSLCGLVNCPLSLCQPSIFKKIQQFSTVTRGRRILHVPAREGCSLVCQGNVCDASCVQRA